MPAWDLKADGQSQLYRVWFTAEVPGLGMAAYTVNKADSMIQIFDEPLHEESDLSSNDATLHSKVG
jgi:hypothetical protein